ncbi:MAG: hypothetical protein AMJ61_00080 [Desulfobacterales bacterium SG8_35_2]|nr:MAG: hypothetical protein AMJ61_00080 [Desulfobacterales bacterium SG8_35_2]
MRFFIPTVFLAILAVNSYLVADIVFPAKLELKEVEPDIFQVTFTLPFINNKKLKALPVLPETCQDLTEHQIVVGSGQYTETWQIRCQADQLYGKQVGIQGLTGTQIDIMLFVETIGGRKYNQMLKPARAFYVVPGPPSFPLVFADGIYRGTRALLRHFEILLLLFLLNFVPLKKQQLLYGLLAFVIAQLLSRYLVQQQWLMVASNIVSLAFLLVVLITSLDMINGKSVVRGWFSHLWIASIIWGFLYGGGINPAYSQSGWSFVEIEISFICLNLGSALGIVLSFLLFREFKYILDQIVIKNSQRNIYLFVGNFVGILSAALIFYRLAVYVFVPSLFPYVSLENMALAILLGLWFRSEDTTSRPGVFGTICLSYAVGLLPGLLGIFNGFISVFVLGGLLFFAVSIIFPTYISFKYSYPIAMVTTFAHGWHVSYYINQNLTLPIANSMGAFILFSFFFFLIFYYHHQKTIQIDGKILRSIGILIALLVILLQIDLYWQWFDDTLAVEWALGYLRIPILSLLLLTLALTIWPRRRRIDQYLKISIRKPILHWVLLGFAFLVIPFGTVQTKSPFYLAKAPTVDTARRVLQQILEDIYQAFNLTDEDLLYDRLSQNVGDNLVADIYLDSRRRLTAGVRQGAKVTVQEVSIYSVKKIDDNMAGMAEFEYECKWAVTARVQHLQHVHHRKNIYDGIIKIKANEDRWKIEDIALRSEDRVIIPGAAG